MCQDKLSERWIEGEAIYSATCAQHQLRNNLLCKFSKVEYIKKNTMFLVSDITWIQYILQYNASYSNKQVIYSAHP